MKTLQTVLKLKDVIDEDNDVLIWVAVPDNFSIKTGKAVLSTKEISYTDTIADSDEIDFSLYKELPHLQIGNLVSVVDWSYVINSYGDPYSYVGRYDIKPKYPNVFEITGFGKLPSDGHKGLDSTPQINDTIIQHIKTKEIIFIQKRFLRKV